MKREREEKIMRSEKRKSAFRLKLMSLLLFGSIFALSGCGQVSVGEPFAVGDTDIENSVLDSFEPLGTLEKETESAESDSEEETLDGANGGNDETTGYTANTDNTPNTENTETYYVPPVTTAPDTWAYTEPTPPVTTAAPVPDVVTMEEKKAVFTIVNTERAKYGLSPLKYRDELQAVCDLRAQEITVYFSHTRPDGSVCFTALDEADIFYWTVGENIAYGYASAADVMDGWMHSEGHRANILSENFTEMAVGAAVVNGMRYWVQVFTG